MTKCQSRVDKGPFTAIVAANRQIGQRFYRLSLEFKGTGGKAFAKTVPGQFVQIDLSCVGLPTVEAIPEYLRDVAERKVLLRRPFSFCDVSIKGDKTFVEILYCAIGPASLRMTTLVKGNSISVIGPLGNGFRIPDDKKTAVLVIGGMGAGPLIHLAKVLRTNSEPREVIAFVGANTAIALPFEGQLDGFSKQMGFSLSEFTRYDMKSLVATDDGSAGYKGFVTDCLEQWLSKYKSASKDMIIYSCGPEAMLAKVAWIAQGYNIDCQVSMEEMMACGIGLCQSCAVECKAEGAAETVYKMCCTDGPVFDSDEVVFKL